MSLLDYIPTGVAFTGRTIAGPANITRGEHVFCEHCHQCHTGGESAPAPALKALRKTH